MNAENKQEYWLERIGILLILLAFAASQYALRMNMFVYSDDAVAVEDMSNMTRLEYIRYIYGTKNGRVLTDPLGAFLGQWEFGYWAILDVLLYMLAACLAAYLLRTVILKLSESSAVSYAIALLVSCVLTMCLPVSYLLSAGFILTSTNYVYTSFGIVFCLAAVVALSDGEMKLVLKWLMAFLGAVGALYASNQEQTACVLGGALLGYLVVDFFRHSGRVNRPALLYLVLDGIGLLAVLTAPGHIARSQEQGGPFTVPGYESWNILDKLARGITATFANIYFQPVLVFALFCVLLFVTALICNRKPWALLSSGVLVAFAAYEKFTGYNTFVTFYDYSYGLPDTDGSIVSLLLMAGITILILFTIWASFENKWEAVVLFWTLSLSAASRIVMGFSASLYGSSFRTFIPQLVLISLVDGYLLLRILQKMTKNVWKVVLLVVLFVTACLYYRYNYDWLIWCWEKLRWG